MGEFETAMAELATTTETPSSEPQPSSTVTDAPPASAEASAPDPSPSVTASAPAPVATPPQPSTTSPTRGPDGKFASATPKPQTGDLNVALREAREQHRQLRDRYGWLPEQSVQPIRQFYEAWSRDPVGTLLEEVRSVLQHPTLGAQAREALAKLAPAPTSTPAVEPEPEPDLQTSDGVLVYSASQLAKWRQWNARQDEQKFDEKLKPVQSFVTEQKQRALVGQLQQQATTNAKTLMAEMQTYPHFEANKAAIKEKFAEFSQAGLDGRSAMYRAYLTVLHGSVLPTLSQTEAQRVVSALQAKPGATSPNPARSPAAGPQKAFTDFEDAMRAHAS